MDKGSSKKSIIITICVVLVVVAAIISAVVYKNTRPSIILSTDHVYLEAGESFDADKFISEIKNTVSENIIITGSVDSTILGDYTISYDAEGVVCQLIATVSDNVAPVITEKKEEFLFLTTDDITPESLITKADDITGVTLSLDTAGADLTKAGTYTVYVVATDAAGNETRQSVDISVKEPDTEAPVIDGVEDVTVTVGGSVDLMDGISVTDNEDDEIEVVGNFEDVDFSTEGVYVAIYTATDASGNEASVSCNVTVEAPAVQAVATPVETVPVNACIYKPEGGTFSWDATGIPNQPYLVCVNRALCTVTVYGKDNDGNYTVPVKAMACSVGREGHATPTGRYVTTARYEWTLMVDNSWGRYAIRINGGIMFHSVCYYTPTINDLEYDEFNKLGSPASLGCVRLCLADEIWLHTNCPPGFTTIIYDDYSCTGPLGKPQTPIIDTSNEATRGWDPTDPQYPF